jgi:hypothetical protein
VSTCERVVKVGCTNTTQAPTLKWSNRSSSRRIKREISATFIWVSATLLSA